MDDETTREIATFIAALFIAPYIIGPPIAAVWVGVAFFVRWLTGWRGLLPADVWTA